MSEYDEWEQASLDHYDEFSERPPTITPRRWPEKLGQIRMRMLGHVTYSACLQAREILKDFDEKAIHEAAYQMEQTFDFVGNEMTQDVDENAVANLKYLLHGEIDYLDYCVNCLDLSGIVDGALGDDCKAEKLYALLSLSLFARAVESEDPLRAELLGAACYASCAAHYNMVLRTDQEMNEIYIQAAQLTAEKRQADARKRQSQKANTAKHQKYRRAQAESLEWWNSKDYARYPTKKDAAAAYVDALPAAGFERVKTSTIETWLQKDGRDAEGPRAD